MRTKILLLFVIASLTIIGCKDVAKISAEEAGEVITEYLKVNQEYQTAKFYFGEMKFNSDKDMVELAKYRQLANDNYVSLTLADAKKKFLSKDSSYTYLIKLTDKASDLVLKQDERKATVKVVTYELASEQPVNFNRVNDNNAKVTVSLKKVDTPFAPFQKDQAQNSNFITKTYRLKLDKEAGWKVVK